MLTHPTLDQLRQLGFLGMARAFEDLAAHPRGAELDHAEWLGLLLDREFAERQDRRLKARLRYARLRHQAAVRTSTTARNAVWIARCSRSWPSAVGSRNGRT